MSAAASPLAESVAPPRLAHGYASDADALRVVARLYQDARADALLDHYVSGNGAIGRWALLGCAAELAEHAWVYRAAPSSCASHASSLDAAIEAARRFSCHDPRELDLLEADIRARLSGDMGRPLPESPLRAPRAMIDADQPPTCLAGGVEAGEEAW